MFVAVRSYLLGVKLPDDEAVNLATDLLSEAGWFTDGIETPPDHILILENDTPFQQALSFWYDEKRKYLAGCGEFDGDGCIEDIHRIYGKDVATDVGVETGWFEENDPSLAADLDRVRTQADDLSRDPSTEEHLLDAAKYALSWIKDTQPYDHGDPYLGKVWGKLEAAIEKSNSK